MVYPELKALPEIEFRRDDLIEDKYIPSPELLSTLNSHVQRTVNMNPSWTENPKLKSLYPEHPAYSTLGAQLQQSSGRGGATFPILVEDKERNILNGVKDQLYQSTLPLMEGSLTKYELTNLLSKDVKMENYSNSNDKVASQEDKEKGDTLQEWKKARLKIMGSLNKRNWIFTIFSLLLYL